MHGWTAWSGLLTLPVTKMAKSNRKKVDSIAREYETRRPTFELFTRRLQALLETLLADGNIRVHAIESRTKGVVEFREKVGRPGKRYLNPVTEITDLTGLRIITYYQ